jgi:phospholipase/carboxylesterase
MRMRAQADEHRLTARPGTAPREQPPAPGLRSVEARPGCEGLLFVPQGYSPEQAWPLAVMCHGAGSEARAGLAPLYCLADECGIVLLAPDSRGATWDLLLREGDHDAQTVDALLGQVLDELAIDAAHVAIGGFSDGASYALSLGLANGDVFTHVIAFSPGFAAPPTRRGDPAVFMSHGRHDNVLPIDRCSRRIAPALRDDGLEVVYEEFEDGHTVPVEIACEAAQWFTDRRLPVPIQHEAPGEPDAPCVERV